MPLPPQIRLALADRVSQLDIPGRLVPLENWHLTLRFLGSVDQVTYERFLTSLSEAEMPGPFTIRLGILGGFPKPSKATVVWVGLEDGSGELTRLNEIAEEAAQSAGLVPEERPFQPHLTLARVRPPEDITHLVEQHVGLGWPANEIVIFKSHTITRGVAYAPLDRFLL